MPKRTYPNTRAARGSVTACTVCGTTDGRFIRGLCRIHYGRWLKYGRTDLPERTDTTFARLLAGYEADSAGCWIWQRGKVGMGYGYVYSSVKKRHVYAHRASYHYHVGPIPEGLLVLHRCDVPACINPEHLFLGTTQDNIADKVAKNRQATTKGKRRGADHPHSVRLTAADAAAIIADTRSQAAIAADYGVSLSTVSGIKRRKHWLTSSPSR